MRPPRTLGLLAALALTLSLAAAAAAGAADRGDHVLPFHAGPVDPAADLPPTDPAGHDLVLVQWTAFGDSAVVREIAATGAELVQPLAPVSYLVWADARQTRALRELDGVRFAGVLPPALRLSPSVTAETTRLRVTLVAGRERVVLPGGAALAAALAARPEVYSVAEAGGPPALRDEQSTQIVARGTDQPLAPGYRGFLEEIGADGTGVIVANVDGGIDFNHPDLADRMEACIDYSVTGLLCETGNHDDVVGHGTHTLGIMVGTGASGFGDLDGYTYGLGVAPGATAVGQNALNAAGGYSNAFADGFRPVYRESYELGAIVSGNSWGPGATPRGYDEDTREMDTIPRDVVDESGVDDPQAFVLSVMNGGGGESTQGSPDEGKNLIRVGGTVSRDPVGGLGPDDLCTCTAHGPALDGRLLPDLVAPGQQVVSTRATQGTLCGVPFLGWSPLRPALETPPSPLHAGCTGTSMASPHVTGAYAVFVDWFRQNVAMDESAVPSPALVKAAFVNGADDLAGALDADGEPMSSIPNNQQGWGRLNLGNVVERWELGQVHVDQTVAFTASGQSHEVRVEAVDPAEPMKTTLVWTDAPGHGLGGELPAWVNDLDLVVRSEDGTAWLGNVLAGGWSAPGGEPDRMNNVENVYLPQAGDGTYTVTVEAANVVGRASPNAGSPTWQDFALLVTNARVVRDEAPQWLRDPARARWPFPPSPIHRR